MPPEGTVHVVDDDPAMRASLALLLGSAGFKAVMHESGGCLLAALDAEPPPSAARCLVTDVHMPGMGGLELQARLSESPHAMPVIVITGQGDVPAAVRALKGGALDFIEKPFAPDLLLECVAAALLRDAEMRREAGRARAALQRMASLTTREGEVLDKLLDGCANKVVAIDLGISERTVELHRARLMRKLAVRSLAEMMELAIHAGRRSSPSQQGRG